MSPRCAWDALPLFGEALFSLDGPIMKDDEQVKSQLQDAWEDVFLPSAYVGAGL